MGNDAKMEDREYLSPQERVTQFVRKNVFDIAIVLICVARIVFGLAEIQKSGKSIAGIIADGVITLIFSLVLSRLLEGKGFVAGESSNRYTTALDEYVATRGRAYEWIGSLDEWCKAYTEKHYKAKVSMMILPLGLTYEQYISHDFDEEKFTDEQAKLYARVKKVKVQRLTTENLMSGEIEADKEINYEQSTKKAYIKRSTSGDLFSKILLSIVFGYFTLPPIAQWDWAGAVWALLHTTLLLGMCIVKYLNAYNFICDEVRAKLVDKTNKLNLFMKEQSYVQEEK